MVGKGGPVEEVDPVTATILAAIIGSGTAIGTTAFNAANAPSPPKPPDPAELTKQAISTETSNRDVATRQAAQFLPGIQANTSGGLSPDALEQFSASFSGNSNIAQSPQMKELVAKFLGMDTGATNTFGGGSSFGGSNPASPGLVG